MRLSKIRPGCFLPVWLIICSGLASQAATDAIIREFPFTISFELGKSEFAPGDTIAIREVRGSRQTITPGGTYWVEGTYTLSSKDEATLALFMTTKTSDPSPVDANQVVAVKKGNGSFQLVKTPNGDGYLHLSFYPIPSGSDFGTLYFGQGDWVLRANLSNHARSRSGDNSAAIQASLSGPNGVILKYLGDPVEPPANLQASYSQTGLINAIKAAARRASILVERVEIDDSEYPFLVGVVCSEESFPKLKEEIRKISDYEYQGSVGSHNCYTMSIVPHRAYPLEAQQRIVRRATVRMQIFFDKVNRQD